jgi:hypothetical protein
VLALVLGGASPAFALTRQAAFVWAPATGPVAGYAVYASIDGAAEELVATVPAPSAILAVESSATVSVRVAAYDSAGRLGPSSAASDPLRLCPGDFDGDGTVGITDWSDATSCLGQVAVGDCAAADIDLDGVVGISDLKALNIGADACPPKLCLGDFDGDGLIGLTDWTAARSCLGAPAQGACAPGDYNGDGVVSLFEVNTVAKSIGTDACAP